MRFYASQKGVKENVPRRNGKNWKDYSQLYTTVQKHTKYTNPRPQGPLPPYLSTPPYQAWMKKHQAPLPHITGDSSLHQGRSRDRRGRVETVYAVSLCGKKWRNIMGCNNIIFCVHLLSIFIVRTYSSTYNITLRKKCRHIKLPSFSDAVSHGKLPCILHHLGKQRQSKSVLWPGHLLVYLKLL